MARNNSPLGMQFRTCENFGDFADSKSSLNSPKRSFLENSHKYKSHTANTRIVDSGESSLRESATPTEAIQKNQSCVSTTESRPIRGAKNRIQTSSSASADFLLESEKRGTPPKSEKRQLLARRGSGAGGAALLRKEKGESNTKSVDCFGDESPRNDETMHDLSQKDSAQNPKFRSVIVGASGLSLGISIVVAILLGIGAGILMQKIFGVFWVLFLGVFWGIAAAVLNVYKVYKAELRDFETLANDPKYKSTNQK